MASSQTRRKKGIFVTGTDTGVGKTVVAAGLVKLARRAGICSIAVKPIETGCQVRSGVLFPEDGAFLADAAEKNLTLDECVPFRFSLPASPARAAAMEGRSLKISDVEEHVRALAEDADLTVVEGAGGLMVPIQGRLMMIDLAERLGYPTLLVGRTRLGTLNHTLLSVNALKERGMRVAGIVLSCTASHTGPEEEFTPADLARLVADVPVVVLPFLPPDIVSNPERIASTMASTWSATLVKRWIGLEEGP
ncbi:MAG: dethiobiotin synthase [Desulfomonilaceae bacterium]